MSKIKPFDEILDDEDICFIYDPFTNSQKPYWTESSFMIYAALSQLIFTRARPNNIKYLAYDNLMIEMKIIGFDKSETLATRFLVTA